MKDIINTQSESSQKINSMPSKVDVELKKGVPQSYNIQSYDLGYDESFLESNVNKRKDTSSKRIGLNYTSTRDTSTKVNEIILQWWKGEVDKVFDEYFTAYMVDLKNREVGIEFDIESVDPKFRHLLKPKTPFAYYVSRVTTYKGRKTESTLTFSELPSRLPFKSIEELYKRVEDLFGLDSDSKESKEE